MPSEYNSSSDSLPTSTTPSAPYLVGIGASAGGLEALRSFFRAMQGNTGLAFVIVQHLAPDHKSLMAELLQRTTTMPVTMVREGDKVLPDHVYLIPPGKNMTIEGETLHLAPAPPGRTLNLPIDIFFRSLADQWAERVVAVVLSGTGSDGARGIRAVKENGGMIMVQAEASAKFAGMPASAIATGAADFILPVEKMAAQLVNFSQHKLNPEIIEIKPGASGVEGDLERIYALLKKRSGLDFRHYKPETLIRRIQRRMSILQASDYDNYIDMLTQLPSEGEALAKDLLIGVTKFFRDSESFDRLRVQIEQSFARLKQGETLRIWSAACSTGEEAYSLGILCEEIRRQKFPACEYKIFATDVDQKALDFASNGAYPRSVIADLSSDYRNAYFAPEDPENFRIRKHIRDRLIFARQNLLADPPFTKLNLISCRNFLIYIRPSTQVQLLKVFHFSLLPKGLLFLGNSETVGELGKSFESLDNKHRIYQKNPASPVQWPADLPRLHEIRERTAPDYPFQGNRQQPSEQRKWLNGLQQLLLERFAPATIVLDEDLRILYSSGPTQEYLRLKSGPAALDILQMVPRNLSLAISGAVKQAQKEKKEVEFRGIKIENSPNSSPVHLQAEMISINDRSAPVILLTLKPDQKFRDCEDASEEFNPRKESEKRIQSLEDELQQTRLSLQSSIEQQETANEELQAANEELLASNEELQSTNEELESVNEELYTVNAEYQGKIQELTEVNDDILNFARSTNIGTIFLDEEFRIRRFTPAFAQLTGLKEADCGRLLETFAHPVLRKILHDAQRERGPLSRKNEEVLSLPGHGNFLLRSLPYRIEGQQSRGIVASLVDISKLQDLESEASAIFETVDVGICVTDEKGTFLQVNAAYARNYGYKPEELIGKHFTIVVPPEDRKAADKLHDQFIEAGKEIPAVWRVVDKHGKFHKVGVRAVLLRRADGSRRKITVVTDFEELKKMYQEASKDNTTE